MGVIWDIGLLAASAELVAFAVNAVFVSKR
ncbi:hypothetical protein FHX10_002642 [Rhizobium sp. BK591]|jgi:hypothetical protein|nr:hypothetical protein [Rhizobium sp. BK591]MBB4252093.1 hypothetical protein [Rhizobium sp. BK008]